MSYGSVASDKRYQYNLMEYPTKPNILQLLEEHNSSPPSYSAVLAEKYYQEQKQQKQHFTKAEELDVLLHSMRKSMQDTELMILSYRHCHQRLELQNQYLLQKLEESLASAPIDTTISFDTELEEDYQKNASDSLNRMNESLEKLIEEAKHSLDARVSLYHNSDFLLKKSRSCPSLQSEDNSVDPIEIDLQLKQKKRFLYSQWRLAIAMRQLTETIQHSDPDTSHIMHHHVHHVYHHQRKYNTAQEKQDIVIQENVDVKIIPLPPKNTKMLQSATSLTSLFKYVVGELIAVPQPITQQTNKPKAITSTTVKYRTMFFSTLLLLLPQRHENFWTRRSRLLQSKWKLRHEYPLWIQRAHLFMYILKLII
ncbi:uncharacterized protein B0P05DRAFT_592655 [Gilbertella persicaria]|uniref:uncharacterized protein n=1 Tax=Gilbertella persicaria TaxID=101096 RepID=UPI0022204388|nr:uncharacterized protein B0P05DRAFT_592655 [Gilbertella persicaria]KAI8047387.1 hypothetical protein B0P05DRAFT_592655 [Gilbertella persicaria]